MLDGKSRTKESSEAVLIYVSKESNPNSQSDDDGDEIEADAPMMK